jgi:hypothetical protein
MVDVSLEGAVRAREPETTVLQEFMTEVGDVDTGNTWPGRAVSNPISSIFEIRKRESAPDSILI